MCLRRMKTRSGHRMRLPGLTYSRLRASKTKVDGDEDGGGGSNSNSNSNMGMPQRDASSSYEGTTGSSSLSSPSASQDFDSSNSRGDDDGSDAMLVRPMSDDVESWFSSRRIDEDGKKIQYILSLIPVATYATV